MTLFAAGCLVLLLLLGAALGVTAAMFRAHRVAQSAADLAALAGAATVGSGDPCAAADRVAGRNGTTLLSCTVAARDVRVVVEAPGPRWLGQVADLAGEARAGPAP
ncbi:Rv3654c family TadE-like protein [Nocardioides sp. SYSU DS0663]|uniref:Rv3654c family TadE-like protein n=1 Tax=Nocardioides sp. SYSU DS0663 TaxID=3416445 RepID=UPI003F4C560F